jgi:hypothetical protein
MFGDFLQNFGLNAFPWDSLDPQGGLFGQNAPQTPLIGSQPSGTAPPHAGPGTPAPPSIVGGTTPQGSPPGGGPGSPLSPAAQSPLASPASFATPGTPNPSPSPPTAPAAGVGSAFGNPLQ